jgi:hypothetical protein
MASPPYYVQVAEKGILPAGEREERNGAATPTPSPIMPATPRRPALTNVLHEQLALVVEGPNLLAGPERQVLEQLDPPLNLDEMPVTPGRAQVSTLRSGPSRIP